MVDDSTRLFVVDAARHAAKNVPGDPPVTDVRDMFVALTDDIDRIDPDTFDDALKAAKQNRDIYITRSGGRDKVQVLS